MNGFDAARGVEAQAMRVLLPYLEDISEGKFVLIERGSLARWLQRCVGDVLLSQHGAMIAVEIKSEQKYTGNVFLEIWSNRNLENRLSHADRGQTPGWLVILRADWLLYYFIDKDKLFAFDVFELKRWLFGHDEDAGAWVNGRFRQSKQQRYVQMNDTWGIIVPLDELRGELPRGAMRWTSVRQRELREMARRDGAKAPGSEGTA